jgi:GT2 family glycosyltransferase
VTDRAESIKEHPPQPRDSFAAVVVHYRTPELLASCIRSLAGQSLMPDQIVVVDNSGDSLAAEPQGDSGWQLVRTQANCGFGAACNLGAGRTAGQYVLFVNADLTLEPQACERLLETARERSAVAVVGPRIYDADGAIELSARSFPSLRTGVLGRSSAATRWLQSVAGRPPRNVGMALSATAQEVDWVSGACMLVRHDAFDSVQGFDERYWMYWEDADLCRRLRDRGWRTMLCIDAVTHHQTGSSGQSPSTVAAFHDSAGLYYELHVARSKVTARLGVWLLQLRKRLVLRRHASEWGER